MWKGEKKYEEIINVQYKEITNGSLIELSKTETI